jgi:hypothetical protein
MKRGWLGRSDTNVPGQQLLDAADVMPSNPTLTIHPGLQSVVTRQMRLQRSCASTGEYRACLALMSREAIKVEPLISEFALFERLYGRKRGLLKVVLQPEPSVLERRLPI